MTFRIFNLIGIDNLTKRSGSMTPLSYEQGPIRPPSEAYSLLLRVTRNCPWNRCEFCHTYKKEKFSLRTVEEIKRDIQTIQEIVSEIKSLSWRYGLGGECGSLSRKSYLTRSTTSFRWISPSGFMALWWGQKRLSPGWGQFDTQNRSSGRNIKRPEKNVSFY